MHKALALLLLAAPLSGIVWQALNVAQRPVRQPAIPYVGGDTDTTTALRVPPLRGLCGGHCGTERQYA